MASPQYRDPDHQDIAELREAIATKQQAYVEALAQDMLLHYEPEDPVAQKIKEMVSQTRLKPSATVH